MQKFTDDDLLFEKQLIKQLMNPAAFPRPASKGNNYATGEEDVVVDPQVGMTLMDYFAGQIIQGLVSQDRQTTSAESLADRAYQIATEMIGARRVFLK